MALSLVRAAPLPEAHITRMSGPKRRFAAFHVCRLYVHCPFWKVNAVALHKPLTIQPFSGNRNTMSFLSSLRAMTFKDLFENTVILSSLTSWVFAQIVKALVVLLGNRKKSPRELIATIIWRTGGMPSSHAAVVCSMAVAVGVDEGFASNLFAVCFFFAMVVMRDAMGVRRSSGLQARALNLLGKNASDRLGFEYHPVKEIQGHAPLEVVIGALLGIFIAAAFAWL
jgi:acid phosphatase family membrane protein YuiD